MVKSNKPSANSLLKSKKKFLSSTERVLPYLQKTCHQSLPERDEYSSHIYAPFFEGIFNIILLLRVV
jgi:hypothetical protein